MYVEWQAWSTPYETGALGGADYPDLLGADGRPPGWSVKADLRYTSREGLATVACLTRRDEGGWILVEQHVEGSRRSWVGMYATSLDEMHVSLCNLVDSGSIGKYDLFEKMVVGFIAAFYDAGDPVEAAEQILVGLGARPRLMPAALPTLDAISSIPSKPNIHVGEGVARHREQ